MSGWRPWREILFKYESGILGTFWCVTCGTTFKECDDCHRYYCACTMPPDDWEGEYDMDWNTCKNCQRTNKKGMLMLQITLDQKRKQEAE